MKISRKNIQELSYKEFKNNHIDNYPLIIEGAMEDWDASDWDINTFNDLFGDKKVPIRGSENKNFSKYSQVKLSDYINHLNKNEDNWYCDFSEKLKGFEDLRGTYEIPAYFSKEATTVYNGTEYPTWFYFGSKGTGTPLHVDIHNSNAWNGLLFGKKKWILFPPNSPVSNLQEDVGDIDLFTNQNEDRVLKILDENQHIQFIQRPGDLVYIPSDWLHQVINTDTSLCITGNFWLNKSVI